MLSQESCICNIYIYIGISYSVASYVISSSYLAIVKHQKCGKNILGKGVASYI